MNLSADTPAPASTVRPIGEASVATAPGGVRLSLTDFLDLGTLQEIQDSFTAVTRLVTTIRDATDQPITQQTDAESRDASDEMLEPSTRSSARSSLSSSPPSPATPGPSCAASPKRSAWPMNGSMT